MAMYKTEYVVEGSGDFPIDMLRYDCSFPARGIDSHAIDSCYLGTSYEYHTKRLVTLAKYHEGSKPLINEARWRSFAWRVVHVVETRRL